MSEQNDCLLHPLVIEMLYEIEKTLARYKINYYLVGAFARDVQFKRMGLLKSFRRTDDIDIALYVSCEDHYHEVINDLLASGNFTRDANEVIKLYYKKGLELDLIPFGEIENDCREVRLTSPKVFTLQMPGFLEIFPFIERVKSGDLTLHTSPLEGLIMLKLISNNDRPSRSHDLEDINNIIDVYFDLFSDEIFGEHNDLFELYDVNDLYFYQPKIAAHVLGRKMKQLLEPATDLYQRLVRILENSKNKKLRALLNGLSEE